MSVHRWYARRALRIAQHADHPTPLSAAPRDSARTLVLPALTRSSLPRAGPAPCGPRHRATLDHVLITEACCRACSVEVHLGIGAVRSTTTIVLGLGDLSESSAQNVWTWFSWSRARRVVLEAFFLDLYLVPPRGRVSSIGAWPCGWPSSRISPPPNTFLSASARTSILRGAS